MDIKLLEQTANFLFETGTLRKIARSHRQNLLEDDLSDNIASHSYRVTIVGYFLAVLEKVDITKVLIMCLFHDIPETRSGDQNWVHKKYVKSYKDEIILDQTSLLPEPTKLIDMMTEYKIRKSKESKVAKDADFIDQILLLKEYAHRGNIEANRWLSSESQYKFIYSDTAKVLAEIIKNTRPNDWAKKIYSSKPRE